MVFQTTAIVVRNRKVGPVYYALEMKCPPVADAIRPGQFVMVRVSETHSPLLRRPFSITKSYSVAHPNRVKRGHIVILYKKVGRGTEKMTGWMKGQEVDLVGPLGNGFTIPPYPSSSRVVLIGGGVGIASLYPLAEVLDAGKLSILIGGRTAEDILLPYDSRKLKPNLLIATEDGSLGFKGTVIDLFLTLKKEAKDEIRCLYASGPMEMLKKLADLTREERMTVQASLEARMGCGFGACWGCVVRTTDPSTPYHRACKEGPVFDLKEIIWEE